MRINGTGTMYLGFGPRDREDCRTATLWFTILFLPIKPLRRQRLRLHPPRGSGITVEPVAETVLARAEVRRTLLYGWLLFPLLLVWPVPFAVASVPYLESGGGPWWAGPSVVLAPIWICTVAWKLMSWHERRAEPSRAFAVRRR